MKLATAFYPLVSGLVALGLSHCANDDRRGQVGQVKISHGRLVSTDSAGPERVSTAGLTAYLPDGRVYTCSAAIIAADLLVTAAHCVQAEAKIVAFFGPNMNQKDNGEVVAVAASAVQPNYRGDDASGGLPPDDVALLRLATTVPEGYQAAPILPSEAAVHSGQTVVLAGYGITEAGGDSGLLRFTQTTYAGPDQQGRLQVNDRSRRGACSGDSGGPLFATAAGTTYVAGVLSGGPIPCRGINFYTSLAKQQAFLTAASQQLAGGR